MSKNVKKESSCCEISNKEKYSCCSQIEKKDKVENISITKNKNTCCNSSSDKIIIKILGTGCPKCIALKKVVDEAIKNIDKECEVIKVEDMSEILKYQIVSTPALVINENVKSTGKILNIEEVKNLINDNIKSKCCNN